EPLVVDDGDSVARVVDDVHIAPGVPYLGEPVRKGALRAIAQRGQPVQHLLQVALAYEEVEILRVPRNPRVELMSVGAPHEERRAPPAQRRQHPTIEGFRLRRWPTGTWDATRPRGHVRDSPVPTAAACSSTERSGAGGSSTMRKGAWPACTSRSRGK